MFAIIRARKSGSLINAQYATALFDRCSYILGEARDSRYFLRIISLLILTERLDTFGYALVRCANAAAEQRVSR